MKSATYCPCWRAVRAQARVFAGGEWRSALLSAALVLGTPALQAAQVVLPERQFDPAVWSAEEQDRPIAVRRLSATAHSSNHLIRLQGSERPHYHDRHDLTVTLLAGAGRIHLADRQVDLAPGDVVVIPKGTLHWAENRATGASVVFAQFAPAFDGKDRRFVEVETAGADR